MAETTRAEREERERSCRASGIEPCHMCGLPAEGGTWYCGGCWYEVWRYREALHSEFGIAPTDRSQPS